MRQALGDAVLVHGDAGSGVERERVDRRERVEEVVAVFIRSLEADNEIARNGRVERQSAGSGAARIAGERAVEGVVALALEGEGIAELGIQERHFRRVPVDVTTKGACTRRGCQGAEGGVGTVLGKRRGGDRCHGECCGKCIDEFHGFSKSRSKIHIDNIDTSSKRFAKAIKIFRNDRPANIRPARGGMFAMNIPKLVCWEDYPNRHTIAILSTGAPG